MDKVEYKKFELNATESIDFLGNLRIYVTMFNRDTGKCLYSKNYDMGTKVDTIFQQLQSDIDMGDYDNE